MSAVFARALFALALFALTAHAAEGEKAAAAPSPAPSRATLEVGGRHIFTFRATLLSYGPDDRARSARTRLFEAYQKNDRLTLSARHTAEGTLILADGVAMFLVTPGDVNTTSGETPELAAGHAIDVMRRIVDERLERRDPSALTRDVGLAVAAALVAYLLLRFIFLLDQRVSTVFARRAAEHATKVQVSGVSVLDESFTARIASTLVHWTAWAFGAIVVFLALNAILESLPFTRPWGEKLTGILVEILEGAGAAFLDALPGLMLVVVIMAIARLASQAASFFFDRIAERDVHVGRIDRYTAKPTKILVVIAIWIFALAMAYPYIPGSESRAFQGLSVLFGLMVSLGASSIIGQAAAGLILMYTHAFRNGEYVRIQDTEGTVQELGIFVTRVRTGLGDEVTLPNNLVLANVARNYSRGVGAPHFVITATATIGYDVPWRQVHAMLDEAARRTEGVQTDPAPRVFQTALDDFYVAYQLSARCAVEGALARAEAMSHLHAHIQDVFNEHGVQIMSPHYLGDPDVPKVVPPSRWFEAPAKPDKS